MDHPMAASGEISSRRHSPAPPLAPLEFLQSQRRGSLTDPSLHVAPIASGNVNQSSSQFRQHDILLSPHSKQHSETRSRNTRPPPLSARPTSPYIFGEPSAQSSSSSNLSGRVQLTDDAKERGKQEEKHRTSSSQRSPNHPKDDMDTDPSRNPADNKGPDDQRLPANFDYSMRRHSVPSGPQLGLAHQRGVPSSPSQTGAKRKMSTDRAQLPVVGEEIDPELAGPGLHTSTEVDPDQPAPKRRNSAFETHRMAQMSLYDRRDSLDSRMSSGGTPTSAWWSNDRRDSSSSMFSGTSMGSSAGFNSPAFAGEMHGRQQTGSMSAFAWPPNSSAGSNDASAPQGMQAASPLDPNLNRQFEAPIPPHTVVPSNNMPVDRRMSAPDAMTLNSSVRADRSLRSRSRPPSRSAITGSRTNEASPTSPDMSPSSARPEESPVSSGSASQNHAPSSEKSANHTPYSRSPELRISHKLAERKRRKEMRDLFDELRDQLPADRGMKASKWEILSKGSFIIIPPVLSLYSLADNALITAIDFIQQLKQSQADMAREIEMLRHEMETVRVGVSYGHHPAAPHQVMYPPPGHYVPTGPQQPPPPPPHTVPPQQPLSRPGSSHNAFVPGTGPTPATNGKAQS
ncbi:hypothetical protein A7U60_g1898 [Sanghuangporus baumii]|uniref:BHLH domain-containing protein n=1 Tax=Sanghuangporus baumii TaxID=108892 RepID=A0A9Q5NEC0_SANBA|nr:hypothetical protein A7U60_g1898 [Sanghuangporus baumii]